MLLRIHHPSNQISSDKSRVPTSDCIFHKSSGRDSIQGLQVLLQFWTKTAALIPLMCWKILIWGLWEKLFGNPFREGRESDSQALIRRNSALFSSACLAKHSYLFSVTDLSFRQSDSVMHITHSNKWFWCILCTLFNNFNKRVAIDKWQQFYLLWITSVLNEFIWYKNFFYFYQRNLTIFFTWNQRCFLGFVYHS